MVEVSKIGLRHWDGIGLVARVREGSLGEGINLILANPMSTQAQWDAYLSEKFEDFLGRLLIRIRFGKPSELEAKGFSDAAVETRLAFGVPCHDPWEAEGVGESVVESAH